LETFLYSFHKPVAINQATLKLPSNATPESSRPPRINLSFLDINLITYTWCLTDTTYRKLHHLVTIHKNLFQRDKYELSRTDCIIFDFDTSDAAHIKYRQFPHPEVIHDKIKVYIDRMLDFGVIGPIQSEWSSPCFIAPKKNPDGTWGVERYVMDVRSFNSVTRKMSYPLAKIIC